MEEYDLNQTINTLIGPPKEQIIVQNFWAATALDKFHNNSSVEFEFVIHGESKRAILHWNSEFSKLAMKENKDIANQGGVALAWFVMSVLLNYKYVEQTEIGDGVDYFFRESAPNDDELNFLENNHYVEVSGILEESETNTLRKRIKDKHNQISKGNKSGESSSIIVTLFSKPKTVKEFHQ